MAPGDFEVNFNTPPHEETDIYGIAGTLHYAMDNDAQLTSITAFRNSILRTQNDLDYSMLDLFSVRESKGSSLPLTLNQITKAKGRLDNHLKGTSSACQGITSLLR